MTQTTSPAARAPLPRIAGRPLVGSALDLQRDPIELLMRVARVCGDVGSFRLGPRRVVLVNSPDLVHRVMIRGADEYDKGDYYRNVFRPILGDGLLTSEGALHKRQRELMAPLFTRHQVARFADAMVALADEKQAEWDDGQSFDLVEEMAQLAMLIGSKALLGTAFPDTDRMVGAVRDVFEWGMHTMTHPFAAPRNIPTPLNRRASAALDLLRLRIGGVIAERWNDDEDRGDLLSIMLLARYPEGERMSEGQLYDEVLTVCGAALETTIGALSWTYYAVSRHPEIAASLEREADSVLGGRRPTFHDLEKLPYAAKVFRESLRLYPPASIIPRTAVVDTELSGFPIPRGTIVFISPYVLHRRHDLYDEPERFDPERFAPEAERTRPRYSFIPFGVGPRTCIGNHFTLMEGHLVLATLARSLRFEPVSEQPVLPELKLNLRPSGGVPVRVRRRP